MKNRFTNFSGQSGKYRIVVTGLLRASLSLVFMCALSSLPALASGSNPFPTRGDQSLGNLVSGALSILSWLALAVGIGSFAFIPIKVFMKSEWMNYVWSGITGVGLWGVMGSLAYMLANNQAPNLPGLGQ